MTKKEAAKLLRRELSAAIRNLPDANYVTVSRFEDEVRDDEETQYVPHGHLFQIELIAEVDETRSVMPMSNETTDGKGELTWTAI